MATPSDDNPMSTPSTKGIDATAALNVIATAADLAFAMDAQGRIEEVRVTNDQLPLKMTESWIGRHWADTVTTESRIKVEELIREAAASSNPRWRHINYPSDQGPDVPLLCSIVQVGKNGELVAFGRDLRSMASLQQRLVEAHQAMERDYLRMRHMETRYRLLFELASEAVLIVDSATQKILEANPAASHVLNLQVKRLIGKPIGDCIAESHRGAMNELLNQVGASGEPDARTIPGVKSGQDMMVSASLFRQETGTMFLVRLATTADEKVAASMSPRRALMLDALERSPDAFIVTDTDGKILTCNHAFVEMAQLTKTEQAVGRDLSDYLGRADVDLNVLIANIQQRGAVRLFATLLHGANGSETQVEISGVSVRHSPVPCLGFSVREVGQRIAADRPSLQQLPRSADQLVELVGRVPLQEIVSETADLIEKLCIEAALRLTRDNRASAAEMLGLSRQSLYVKLRRYNIGEVADRSKK